MKIEGTTASSFILLSGIEVQKNIKLSNYLELQTADTSHLDLKVALSACTHPDDIAVVAVFIPRITAQFFITAESPKELAVIAWNCSLDALLLSAIFQTEIGFNLQSDTTSRKINAISTLRATNLYMRGLTDENSYRLTIEDAKWLNTHFSKAQQMLDIESFQTAVHCLASYRWHSVPRIKMAVIWAGIEGLFGASTEIRFRISLYIARFLYPKDSGKRKETFDAVKKLYNTRSKAVHGSKLKGDVSLAVEESADILCKVIIQCIETNLMPDENDLIP